MKHWSLLGLAGLLLHATHAVSQTASQRGHTGHAPPPASKPATVTGAKPEPRDGSAFAGYRRFDPDEPLKDWRAANEEVRAAGGHIGLMKGAAGTKAPTAEGHGAHGHGKKQP